MKTLTTKGFTLVRYEGPHGEMVARIPRGTRLKVHKTATRPVDMTAGVISEDIYEEYFAPPEEPVQDKEE